jgi:hypothetical protein
VRGRVTISRDGEVTFKARIGWIKNLGAPTGMKSRFFHTADLYTNQLQGNGYPTARAAAAALAAFRNLEIEK